MITKKIQINVDKLLDKHGLTQKELSKLSGVRQAAISNLRRGFVSRISIEHIERIASALNIDDISDLLELVDKDKDND